MASRRRLKKNINYIIGELFTESLVRCVNAYNSTREKVEPIMGKILELQNEFVTRISHTQKGNEKEFYKKFKTEFSEQVTNIAEEIININ